MKSSQVTLSNLKPEYCEHSEPLENYFRCKLTDFGFVWRCTMEERSRCPDLTYFLKQQKERKK